MLNKTPLRASMASSDTGKEARLWVGPLPASEAGIFYNSELMTRVCVAADPKSHLRRQQHMILFITRACKSTPAEHATLEEPTRSVEEIDRTHQCSQPRRPGCAPSIARGDAHTWSTTRKIFQDPPGNGDFQTMKSTQCQAL